MWCTRWFLPLLLLPLPSAPPYFLILFLVSITIHAKPCFYCIILLTTLFISTCYWPPISIDTLLSTPWAQNITTFGHALRVTLASNYTKPIPPVMRPLDRCWCDLSTGGLFEPYNFSQWEVLSIKKQSSNLEREQLLESVQQHAGPKPDDESNTFFITHVNDEEQQAESTVDPVVPTETGFWSRLNMIARGPSLQLKYQTSPPTLQQQPPPPTEPPLPREIKMTNAQPQVASSDINSLIRQEYDLRPYGLGIIVDLRWSR